MAHEYAPVTVQGRPLRCLVCSHDIFAEQHIQQCVSVSKQLMLPPPAPAAAH